jgi:hypothetical protein
LAEVRQLQVLSDYECFPVWRPGPSSVENVDPATLPVSQELAAALMSWAEEYEATLNQEYPPDSGFPLERDRRDFLQRGRHLAGRLARELGPGYRVTYQGDGSIPEQVVDGAEPSGQ